MTDNDLAKLVKKLPSGFEDEALAMNETQLRNLIVDSENNIRTAEIEMKENEAFQKAKESYKLAAEPFKETKTAQKAKIQFALHLLESSGKI